MSVFQRVTAAVVWISALVGIGWSDAPVLKLEFAGETLEANRVTVEGAGFGMYPKAEVSFGTMPVDNAFAGATDGQGLIVKADPGKGVIVFAPKLHLNQAALVRVSVRTDTPHASVILATIGEKPNTFISFNTPDNEAYFQGRYLRLQTLCAPPSGGFQPLIQVVNTGSTEALTAYVDNFEVYSIDDDHDYPGEFLDGDETDPPTLTAGSSLAVNIPITVVPLEMLYIPPGTFTMGTPGAMDMPDEYRTIESPQHSVTLTQGFYLGKYEVTQAQWQALMGSNPSYFKGDNRPVEMVSWNDCQAFLQKLNQSGLGSFRLPTEAEWEYACRAGTTTVFYFGDIEDPRQAGPYLWCRFNSDNQTHEVGLKPPNAWGLYDMVGNVEELCQDCYRKYTSGEHVNPKGPNSGYQRIIRGGSWNDYAFFYSAYRNYASNSSRRNTIGFRLAWTP